MSRDCKVFHISYFGVYINTDNLVKSRFEPFYSAEEGYPDDLSVIICLVPFSYDLS